MTEWLMWKIFKFIGISLFSFSIGAAIQENDDIEKQSRIVNWTSGIGFILLWISGYGIVKSSSFSMSESWIQYGQILNILAISLITSSVHSKKKWLKIVTCIACLVGAILAMVLKGLFSSFAIAIVAFGSVVFIYDLYLTRNTKINHKTDLSWFKLISTLEAVSLILLFFVYMPLKYKFGVVLDNNQGWFGWAHGVMQVAFIISLFSLQSVRVLNFKQVCLGVVASLLPFGPFYFERKQIK